MTKFLNISTDTTLGGSSASDEVVSSQKALKTYIDNNGSTYTAGTGIDITSNTISVTYPTLTNKQHSSSGTSLVIASTINYSSDNGNAIGIASPAFSGWYDLGNGAIAIGSLNSSGNYSINIGGSSCSANFAIQLGFGSNSEASSFYVGTSLSNNWKLLGSDGLVPVARISYDNSSITANSSNQLQTVGVIDQANSSRAIKTWTGTKAQYDLILSKDANTVYNITDDTNPTQALLESIYPVGSIYIGTMAVCPIAALFGTWTLVGTKILTDIPAQLAAKGNGIGLGLTNGNWNGTLSGNGTVHTYYSSNYGGNVGANTISNNNAGDVVVGVVSDATKSGIVADTNASSLTVNLWQRSS